MEYTVERVKNFTEEEKKMMLEMFAEGVPYNEMARRLGRQSSSVHGFFWARGVQVNRPRKLFTEDQLKTIWDMYEKGSTQKQIAEAMEIPIFRLERFFKRTDNRERVMKIKAKHGRAFSNRQIPVLDFPDKYSLKEITQKIEMIEEQMKIILEHITKG